MIPCQRYLFDIPHDVAYLNCAYMSPLMKPALEAGTAALNRKAQPWQITPDQFFTGSEEFRATAAQFLDCSADCVAIVPSAGYGIATAARNLPGCNEERAHRPQYSEETASAGAAVIRCAPVHPLLAEAFIRYADRTACGCLDFVQGHGLVVSVSG